MTAIYCHKCGRPNASAAKTCIWCSVALSDNEPTTGFDTTSVEMSYSSGIERLEDAGPVRLIISAKGIEVLELMPGSRSVNLPADCLLDANVTHSRTIRNGREASPWWRRLLTTAGATGNNAHTVKHDAVLTITYRVGEQVHEGVFYRDDPAGVAAVVGVAKIVSALVKP